MSNKSLVQIVMALQQRVAALEARPINAAPQEKTVARDTIPVNGAPPAVAAPTRKMCPKCGVKPGYFFHVRTCTGQKEEQKDADTDRRRDQGTP